MYKAISGAIFLLASAAPFGHMDVAADSLQGPQSITSPCANIGLDDVFAVGFSTGELIKFQTTDPIGTKTTLLTAGSLVSPTALIVGPDCDLYIGESGDGSTFAPRVSKFELDTLTLSTVYAFSDFSVFPGSFVFLGDDLLIGRDPKLIDKGPIVRLTGATGGIPAVSDYTSGGPDDSSPGLALDHLGRLYFSDQDYNFNTSIASGPVSRFDDNSISTVIADGNDGLAGPAGLVYRAGKLYVASYMSGEILQTDLTSSSTQVFADTGTALAADRITTLVDGKFWVGGSVNGNLYQFSDSGTLLTTFASGLSDVGGITSVATYNPSIGGSVSGLGTGQSLVLQNNARDDLTITANGSFTFDDPLPQGSDYSVSIKTQADEQTCIVSNPTGTVNGADVSNIAVTCTTNSYSVGGVLTGLADGLSVTLQNNGGDDLTLTNDGAFSFPSPVLHNTAYAVSVSNQPGTQTCVVSDGSGTVNGSAISNVSVSCSDNNYSVGGQVSGLLSETSLVLQNNGGDDLTVTANGAFTFDGLLLQGSAYAVTIKTQPVGQTCALKNATGASINANLTNIEVVCSVNSYAVGGVVNGLATGLSVTLQNNGGDDLTLSANGNFIFSSLVPYNSSYSVSVGSQPSTQTCVVTDGSGTVSAAAITDVVVACTDNTFSVGGELSGLLPGRSLVLQNNAGDDLSVSGNGAFAFNTGLTSGSGYVVSVKTQPAGQVCSVDAGLGSVAGADVVDITISCTVIPTIFRDQFEGST